MEYKFFEVNNIGEISDGYHTFNELYYHRMILFSIICKQNPKKAWRSKLHSDGTMFKDYFVVGINTPEGQYNYHYNIADYNNFEGVPELDRAPVWDGHVPGDILRLKSLI
jgi:hypothetical protein